MVKEKIYTKLIIESIVNRKPLGIDFIPYDLIKTARINKVLYLLGLYNKEIQRFLEWHRLKVRHEEQKKAMFEIANIAENSSVDFMVVKTIKPFPYVPDDIDILVINDDTFEDFVETLLRKGYFLRKKGTREITLRKVINETYVDLDIHTKLSAGTYEYIDKLYLWKRRDYIRICGFRLAVPNIIDELLITATHAVMKELLITIADMMSIIVVDKAIRKEALKRSAEIGNKTPLKFLIKLGESILECTDLQSYPLPVPFYIVALAYAENIKYRIQTEGLLPLKEIALMPSSKGISILFNRFNINT